MKKCQQQIQNRKMCFTKTAISFVARVHVFVTQYITHNLIHRKMCPCLRHEYKNVNKTCYITKVHIV